MKVGEDMPKLPAGQFLVDSGLLFEINRKILHPFGLALQVVHTANEDGTETMEITDLQDFRDDPEGMIFGEKTFRDGMAKLTAFMEEFGNQKLITRNERLGYVIQHSEQELIQSPDLPAPSLKQKIMIKRVGTAPGTQVDVDKFARSSGQLDEEEDQYLDTLTPQSEEGPDDQSVESRMVQKIKAKMNQGKGIITKSHMRPDGNACTNPTIVNEKISGGGSVVFCSSCGTQLKDSDLATKG